MKKYPFLLEIGCENLPPSDLKIVEDSTEDILGDILKEYRVGYSSIKVMSAARRIAVKINSMASHQKSVKDIVKGPPAAIAVKNGQPTKAGIGFAKSQGLSFNDLIKKETGKGEYYFAEKDITGKAVRDIIPEIAIKFINSFEFPVKMRWPGSDVKFPRPIRWLLVKFGSQAVKFNFGNISAGRTSRGHYMFADHKIYLEDIKDYKKVLKRNYVYVDSKERMEYLKKAVKRPLKYTTGYPVENEDLYKEINHSVEFPTGIKGKFPKKYLELPREIIEACLVYHQKYFPVEDKEGKLLNYFVAVRDGISEYLENIRKGYEKVLIARLKDADFFLKKDRRHSLEDNIDKLKGVQFSRGLGTLYDKVKRLKKLTGILSEKLSKDKDFIKKAVRTAELAKADLVSLIVEEFPELEGTAGTIYARLDGEDEKVAKAIREHYMPRNPGDDMPSEEISAVVGAADRIDTVCGNIAMGVEATGSQDPFGLRRAVKGLINIVVGFKWELNLEEIISADLGLYKKSGIKLKGSDNGAIENFIGRQLKNHLSENFNYDVVRCVMTGEMLNPGLLAKKAEAVTAIKENDKGFDSLITAFKRIKNILKQASEKGIDIPEKYDGRRLKEKEEKSLSKIYRNAAKDVDRLIKRGNYKKVLKLLSSMRKPVDIYFDSVMVMAEDKAVRANRLAMLKNIFDLFSPAGDISELEVNSVED